MAKQITQRDAGDAIAMLDREARAANPIDALPDGGSTTSDDDNFGGQDPRKDPRLDDVAFIGTDEGQALLASAQQADKEARRLAKNAAEKARRDRIKAERDRQHDAAIEKGADAWADSIQAAQDEHPSQDPILEAEIANRPVARPPIEHRGIDISGSTAPIVAKVSGKPARRASTPKASDPKPVENRPLKLGDPIAIGDVQYRAILHRDGSIAEHQTDNYIYVCGICKRRLRDVQCVGGFKGSPSHKPFKAPEGYRASDRIVK